MTPATATAPELDPDRKLTFDRIVGHRATVQFLKQSVKEGRLPQAIALAGPDGVGKKTLAWALIREIVSDGEDAAGHRGSAKVARGTHPDILVCDNSGSPSGQIVIEQIREADDFTATSPLESPKKIIFISPAERMNPAAANCLLKLLEEPPRHVVIILTCVEPAALLPTIRSRCAVLRLEPVAPEDLQAWLLAESGESQSRVSLAVRLAEGRPGRAMAIVRGNLLEQRGSILREISLLKANGFAGIFGVADRLSQLDKDMASTLSILAVLLRDALTIGIGAGRALNEDLTDELAALAVGLSPEGMLRAATLATQAIAETPRYYTPQSRAHFLEVLVSRIGQELRSR